LGDFGEDTVSGAGIMKLGRKFVPPSVGVDEILEPNELDLKLEVAIANGFIFAYAEKPNPA
jgi:hypothetical protein